MEIAIFTDLTTNEQLDQLKTESEKYTGLYVDMNKKDERKYVKDKADSINQLLKKVERKRIDASKEYKIKVEAEAADITERLQIANLPFTLLIDEHKAERKKVLDAEAAEKKAREDAIQLEIDHEFALLMNDKFDSDKVALLAAQAAHEEQLRKEGAEEARKIAESIALEKEQQAEQEKLAAIQREAEAKERQAQAERDAMAAQEREKLAVEQAAEQRKQDAVNAENKRIADIEQAKQDEINRQQEQLRIEKEETAKREANKKYLAKVHNGILSVLLANGISEKDGKTIIKLAAKNELPQLTINY